MFFKSYLDKQFVATIAHREHTIVPSGKKKTVKMYLSVPVSTPFKKIQASENIILDGMVWLKLAVAGKNSVTIPIAVTIKKEIPWKKVRKAVEKKKAEIVRTILTNLHEDAPSVIDKGRELLKKLF